MDFTQFLVNGFTNEPSKNCIVNIESCSQVWKIYASKIIARDIPQSIQRAFNQDKWTIKITTEHLGKKFFNSSANCLGVTYAPDSAIYLAVGKPAIDSVRHEFGHYVDWHNGNSSKTSQFNLLYNKYKTKLGTEYSKSTPQEFYADCFNKYLKRQLNSYPELHRYFYLESMKVH